MAAERRYGQGRRLKQVCSGKLQEHGLFLLYRCVPHSRWRPKKRHAASLTRREWSSCRRSQSWRRRRSRPTRRSATWSRQTRWKPETCGWSTSSIRSKSPRSSGTVSGTFADWYVHLSKTMDKNDNTLLLCNKLYAVNCIVHLNFNLIN